jgi:hypothetical protein
MLAVGEFEETGSPTPRAFRGPNVVETGGVARKSGLGAGFEQLLSVRRQLVLGRHAELWAG